MSDEKSTEAPLDWPEDDSPPPPDDVPSGVGMPPPGGGYVVPGGYEHTAAEDGSDTVTENRTDEDEDAER